RREPTDLVALLRRAVADHGAAAGRRPLRLDVEEESLVGQWDPVGLGRVLDNLVSNAIKYSPDSPDAEITLGLRLVDGAAVLRVRDRGHGIPEGEQARVFERFYRGANAGDTPGTGLGLAAALQVVEALGGSLTLSSREGDGAEFAVTLPLDTPDGAESDGAESDGAESDGAAPGTAAAG
ncbi:MAG TPA: sensor histidine kinase, partial [Chloroflexota bacterium]|nr:sensor histidine kinase [Chloroflexota bacterium]